MSAPSPLLLIAYTTYTFPLFGPGELSTARDGKLWIRSLPRIWSVGKNSAAFKATDGPNVTPLSRDTATRVFPNPVVLLSVAQVTYTRVEPPPAKRGIEPVSNVAAPAFSTTCGDQVGGVAVMMLSENVVLICTPPGITLIEVKFDQLIRTRPVSGSMSRNSLSA